MKKKLNILIFLYSIKKLRNKYKLTKSFLKIKNKLFEIWKQITFRKKLINKQHLRLSHYEA